MVTRCGRVGLGTVWRGAASQRKGSLTLSERQERIAQLVAIGFSDKRIASMVHLSEETVAYHIDRIADLWALDRGRNIRVQITQRVLLAA